MMPFASTKEMAKQMRRDIKKTGRCSCYTKLKFDEGYFVQDCPYNLCKAHVKKSRRKKKREGE